MMDGITVAERVLLALSRAPGHEPLALTEAWTLENALSLLKTEYPGFEALIPGRSFLDSGCGSGWQAAALALAGARSVVGVDTNRTAIAMGRARIAALGLGSRVELREALRAEDHGRFEVVFSQNSFEHLTDPGRGLDEMVTALRPGGRLLITFGPPWYAPYGSHCRFFTRVPWVHLLFSEQTVLSVRRHFRSDGARRYEEVSSGLNRMSVGRFEELLRSRGLRVGYRRYRAVRGLDRLGELPLVRELFLNHLTVVASRGWLESAQAADPGPFAEEHDLAHEARPRPPVPLDRPPLTVPGSGWAAAAERVDEAQAG